MPYTKDNRSPEREAYSAAKQRCTNPNHPHYADYGGRGIQFLFPSFKAFLKAMGPRPAGLTLERLDTNGHYMAGNCAWRSQTVQVGNRRPYGTHGYKGVGRRASGRYFTQVTVNKKNIVLPTVDTALEAAQAYDAYVITNHLDRSLNFAQVVEMAVAA